MLNAIVVTIGVTRSVRTRLLDRLNGGVMSVETAADMSDIYKIRKQSSRSYCRDDHVVEEGEAMPDLLGTNACICACADASGYKAVEPNSFFDCGAGRHLGVGANFGRLRSPRDRGGYNAWYLSLRRGRFRRYGQCDRQIGVRQMH